MSIKIGISNTSLNLPLKRALAHVQKFGVPGFEFDAVGDLSPSRLSATGRRELQHLLRSHNLELAGVGCPLRFGLNTLENQEARIDHVRQVMTLSSDLGPRRVHLFIGAIGTDENDPGFIRLVESVSALARHGDRIGVTLEIGTGPDEPQRLGGFLARFDSGTLAVSYDPAGLMMNGHDPYAAARTLAPRIGYVRARDARTILSGRTSQEVPLGHGDVDWLQVLGCLEEIAYRGWVIIERHGGNLAEIAAGVKFLQRIDPH